MSHTSNRNYFHILTILLFVVFIKCDQNTIKNQIDQQDSQKTSISQQKDQKFTSLYQAEQSLKMINSEIVQAKMGASDIYSAFYNEDQRCKGLKIGFNRFYNTTQNQNSTCLSDIPLESSQDELFKGRLQLQYLENFAQKAQRLYNHQMALVEDRSNQSDVYSRLKTIANNVYVNASNEYTQCMDDYANDNDTEPLECEDLKNAYEKAMETFEKYYTKEQNFQFQSQVYQAELSERKIASEAASLAESQLRSTLSNDLNQSSSIYDICIANRNNIKTLLNQRLNSTLEATQRYTSQQGTIEGIQAELNSLLEDTTGKTRNIESLSEALRQLF